MKAAAEMIAGRFPARRAIDWKRRPIRSILPSLTLQQVHSLASVAHGDFSCKWGIALSTVHDGAVINPLQYFAIQTPQALRRLLTCRWVSQEVAR